MKAFWWLLLAITCFAFFLLFADAHAGTGIQNGRLVNIQNAVDQTDGVVLEQINGMRRVPNISITNTNNTIIIPVNLGGGTSKKAIIHTLKFVPDTITGTGIIPAVVRCGNNASKNNVAALTTIPVSTAVGDVVDLLLPGTKKRVDISSDPVYLEVQTAATGFSAFTGTLYVEYYLE